MNESALENYYFRPVWVQAFVQVRLIKLVLHSSLGGLCFYLGSICGIH